MSVVMKCVNDIRAAALKRREFCRLLNEVDEQYGELLLHIEVRWLSWGKVLARFLTVKDHMYNFLSEKKKKTTEAKRPVMDEPPGFPDSYFRTSEHAEQTHARKAATRKSPQ